MAEVRRMRPLLGTFVDIRAEGPSDVCHRAISAAFEQMALVERLMSFQSTDSELTRLNSTPRQWLALHPHTWRVLALARALGAASNDLFNCTVGGALAASGTLPDHGGNALHYGSHSDIVLQSGRARLARPVKVVLDGIAKGYAVDIAVRSLKQRGIQSGSINAGGDLRLFGARGQRVVQQSTCGSQYTLGYFSDQAIATSQAGGTLNGQYPSELVGAVTHRPVSVSAPFAWRADALTKIAAALPAAQRARTIAQLGGTLLGTGNAAHTRGHCA